jgi:uncharacterized protein (TIGR03382 family)
VCHTVSVRGSARQSSLLGLCLAVAPGALAVASPPASTDSLTSEGASIVGGMASSTCAWPGVVALQTGGLCTGTLVHPRIVVYAAHCGTFHSKVLFGERVDMPAREIETAVCERNSDLFAVSSMDYAYCLLAEPVDDIPPTPILLGCETQILTFGQPVVIAGFGADDRDTSGFKQIGHTIVSSQAAGDVVTIGAEGTAACSGDSGGPAYVQLGDGGWRAFGIVSGGVSCEESVTYVTMHSMIGWVEAQTGMDFTPCHDADGTWNPGPECSGASIDADAPGADASWPACSGAQTGPSSTCGPAFGSEGDGEPPIVSIEAPLDQQAFMQVPAQVDVLASAIDEGSGVEHVELWVDGTFVDDDTTAPWMFGGASFPAGTWTLEVRAVDWLGNVGNSEVITIHVGEAPEPSETGQDTDESGGSEGTTTTGETGAPTGGESGGSCSCTANGRTSSVAWLGLLALLARRRRRTAGHTLRR